MKPSVKTLGEILYAPSQYVIPVFQRNYRWELPQWEKFWHSLNEMRSPEKKGNHFMGFLVFVPGLAQPGQHTTFHLIDGQQRLTTSSILLTAIRNVARNTGHDALAEEIHQDYLVHPRKVGEQHYRLLPKERDHDSYLAIINGEDDVRGRVANGLAYFEEKLSSGVAQEPEFLRTIFNMMCQRFEFMCATLEAENAYNIFKSLNSTGVPLGSADLIRNFVFMHVLPDDHDEFERSCWSPLEERFATAGGTLDEARFSRFFRDYLMANGRYVAPKETFASFEERYEATEFSPIELAKDLLANSRYYEVISGNIRDQNDAVTTALAGLNALESSTTYPILLGLFQKRAMGNLNDYQLAEAVQMFRGFIFRRFICGESSRGYGQMFVRALAEAIGTPVDAIKSYLLERGWPDDRQFETAFTAFPLYQRGYTKQVLETLERSRGHKEPADLETEIEHIMPQTLSNSWRQSLGTQADRIHADCLHRPGNLTLSGYNLELWNHAFSKKKERYAQSNIVLTRELEEFDNWGEIEIENRGRHLAKEAAAIWIGPKDPLPEAAPQDLDGAIGRHELRNRFWTGLSEYLTAEHPELPKFEVHPNATVRLASGIRNIGFELRFGLQQHIVRMEIWFWKVTSLPLWEKIRSEPNFYNALVDTNWIFERPEGHNRACMSINRVADDLRDTQSWQDHYKWMADNLSVLYESIAPKLREELKQEQLAEANF